MVDPDPQAASEGRVTAARAVAGLVACLLTQAAAAADLIPGSAAAFRRLPALGTLVEGGMEKDIRFRTYLVSKQLLRRGSTDAFRGEVRMRIQDISSGGPYRPAVLIWRYMARCVASEGHPVGLTTRSIRPPEDDETLTEVTPDEDPGIADRTWSNVWHAVCRGEFNKFPRNQVE